jgi:hypothetical protein
MINSQYIKIVMVVFVRVINTLLIRNTQQDDVNQENI